MPDKTEPEGHKALTSATQTAALLVAMARGAGNRPTGRFPACRPPSEHAGHHGWQPNDPQCTKPGGLHPAWGLAAVVH
jgi:hypothetical protein